MALTRTVIDESASIEDKRVKRDPVVLANTGQQPRAGDSTRVVVNRIVNIVRNNRHAFAKLCKPGDLEDIRDTLVALSKDKEIPGSVRIDAMRTLLDYWVGNQSLMDHKLARTDDDDAQMPFKGVTLNLHEVRMPWANQEPTRQPPPRPALGSRQ